MPMDETEKSVKQVVYEKRLVPQNVYDEFVSVPSGSVTELSAFRRLHGSIADWAIWAASSSFNIKFGVTKPNSSDLTIGPTYNNYSAETDPPAVYVYQSSGSSVVFQVTIWSWSND